MLRAQRFGDGLRALRARAARAQREECLNQLRREARGRPRGRVWVDWEYLRKVAREEGDHLHSAGLGRGRGALHVRGGAGRRRSPVLLCLGLPPSVKVRLRLVLLLALVLVLVFALIRLALLLALLLLLALVLLRVVVRGLVVGRVRGVLAAATQPVLPPTLVLLRALLFFLLLISACVAFRLEREHGHGEVDVIVCRVELLDGGHDRLCRHRPARHNGSEAFHRRAVAAVGCIDEDGGGTLPLPSAWDRRGIVDVIDK